MLTNDQIEELAQAIRTHFATDIGALEVAKTSAPIIDRWISEAREEGWRDGIGEATDNAKTNELDDLLGDDTQAEKEPHSESAGGSDADHNPVRTGAVITSSIPSWPSITS